MTNDCKSQGRRAGTIRSKATSQPRRFAIVAAAICAILDVAISAPLFDGRRQDGIAPPTASCPDAVRQKSILKDGNPVDLSSFPLFVEQGHAISLIDPDKKIYYVHDFLAPEEASAISLFGEGRFRRSPQTGIEDLTGSANRARTSQSCPLLFAYFYMPRLEEVRAKSPILAEELELTWGVTQRASSLLGVDEAQFEPFQLLKYLPGEFYKQHHDHRGFYDPKDGYPDRPITMLLFLSDVEEGGNLRFEKLGIDFRPSKGDAIVWSNVDGDGIADPDMVHEAMPVIKGSKMAVNVWVRDKPFTDMRQASMRQH